MTTLLKPAPERRPARAPVGTTELFVLRGDDRAHLIERVRALLDFLDRTPGVDLKDLAGTLASSLAPDGQRLAVVAGDMGELQARLTRSAVRLADPACRQIKDTQGIYYFGRPLFAEGRVAVLFPGEGAQYLGMLDDLRGPFPEVEACFAWCDRLAADAGQPERSLRRLLLVPADAAAAEREAAEQELRRLGPSIFSVLMADWALWQVLQRLQVPVSTVAGHSAGELVALSAAGCLDPNDLLGELVLGSMNEMQRQEEGADGPEVMLLAVGAGKATVAELVGDGPEVCVAMDNCPHQSVVVGPAAAVAPLEAALVSRGIVCERLPFRRPYHTRWFEPFMGPLTGLFDAVTFAPPTLPAYSCTTGQLFPSDPESLRRLALRHWAAPVEFARMVETMYADGVRLFVEAGPRGNLSAFVEDILRGRPFAALAANLPRRSGATQLNHLIGQLVAHGVPLRLEHLYERRDVRRVDFPPPSPPSPLPPKAGGEGGTGKADGGAGGNDARSEVMTQYLAVMEAFLDGQREVMEAFLGTSECRMPNAERLLPVWPLLGDVARHEPGRELVLHRRLDLAEDRFALDHTIGGRNASRVDPDQHGLPVLPMTFSLEIVAEAAAVLTGKAAVGLRDVRLLRWLPYLDEPGTVEVTATAGEGDTVRVSIRDLGNASAPDATRRVAVEATVLLADAYPEPPPLEPFPLGNETPPTVDRERLYHNLFHGPRFQGFRATDRVGTEGIESTVEVLPRSDWFRSTPEPATLTDPVLVDVAMHVLGGWHLEQPDQAGRILLPFELGRIDFFGPPPAVGERLRCRGRTEQQSARHFRHGLDVIGPDGRYWCRMSGVGYWRFYLPFGEINFHGPKDEYFISRPLEAATEHRSAATRSGAGNEAVVMFLDPPADVRHPVMRAAFARVTLTAREQTEFKRFAGTDAQLHEWLFGRNVAKDAARLLWHRKHGHRFFPADLEADLDAEGRLRVWPRGEEGPGSLPAVAFAHFDGVVVGLAAFRPSVGIAIGRPNPDAPDDETALRLRLARQAAAQCLGPARVGDPETLTVRAIGPDAVAVAAADGGQGSILVRTVRDGEWLVATTLGERAPT